ncbi:MAG: hypothetical protein AB8H79_02830 [Myxococcota bacterium]
MSFESALLIPSGSYDRDRLRGWLQQSDAAWLDPIGGDGWHVSAHGGLAERRLAARTSDPSGFPPGVVIFLDDHGVRLVGPSSAADLSRAAKFVGFLLESGDWTMRIDRMPQPIPASVQRLFGADLPAVEDLVSAPFADELVAGTVWKWAQGTGSGPAGYQRLQVHSSGAVEYYTERSAQQNWVEGALSTEALLLWLEAAAYADPDEDDVGAGVPPEHGGMFELRTPDDDWSTYIDARQPPPSLHALGQVATRWMARIDADGAQVIGQLGAETE